jgi:uncharacterized membrane protein YjdF
MAQMRRSIELPLVAFLFLAGTSFLLKMCYLPLTFNTVFGLLFLSAVYAYVRHRFSVKIPVVLLALIFLALQVDALGNYFRLYGQRFGPMQYDEFSHMSVQALITPVIVWLLTNAFGKLSFRVPLPITSLFAASVMFSLAAFYEIIELWDELYFQGQRIWGPYDTATDLQWDFCGIVVGVVLAHVVMISREVLSVQAKVSAVGGR